MPRDLVAALGAAIAVAAAWFVGPALLVPVVLVGTSTLVVVALNRGRPRRPIVGVPRGAWGPLQGQVAELTRGLEALERRTAEPRRPAAGTGAASLAEAPPAVDPAGTKEPTVGRRRAMGALAGATAGVIGAAVTGARPAAGANGAAIILGTTANSATSPTSVAVSASGSLHGFGVTDFTTSVAVPTHGAVYGDANNHAFSSGVLGRGRGAATGMWAESATGHALRAVGGGSQTVFVEGGTAGVVSTCAHAFVANTRGSALRIQGPADRVAPQSRIDAHFAGEILGDATGDLWYCVANGSPGTWRRLSGATTAGSFHLLPVPKRVYDSRPGTSPTVGDKVPLSPGVARVVNVTNNASGVPTGATGAMVTCLLVNATSGNGNVTVWAGGAPAPAANTMVWGGSAGRFATTTVTALSPARTCQVSASLATDVVLDVLGYYR